MRRTDLAIAQGTTWAIEWPITDETGDPVNLSGWTGRSQVRPSADSSTVYHEFSTVQGNLTFDGNKVILTVTPATSTAWQWRSGVYDVELTDTTGQVARIAEGQVHISPEVTR